MDWVHGIKVASVVVGSALAGTAIVVGLIFMFGGWAFIPVLAALFAGIVFAEAAR